MHGEEGITGNDSVTTILANKDLYKFIIGDYEQPSRVFHPILDKGLREVSRRERLLSWPTTRFTPSRITSELRRTAYSAITATASAARGKGVHGGGHGAAAL